MTLHPSIVDGRSLVELRQIGTGLKIVETGILEHDGQNLYLVEGGDSRVITEVELSAIQIVRADSRIAVCRGFDLFLIVE